MADAKGARQLVQRHHRGIAASAFQGAEILLAEPRPLGEPFLGHAQLQPYPFDVLADQGTHIHAPEISGLHSPSLSTPVCKFPRAVFSKVPDGIDTVVPGDFCNPCS